MKRLVVIATLAAVAVSLGVLAALVVRPSPAGSVPAIELVTPSTSTSPPTTTASTQEETAPRRSVGQDGPTASSSSGRGGASPAPAPQPAPAGDDDDGNDDDGDDGGDD